MSSNGIDSILVVDYEENFDAYIEINDIKKELSIYHIEAVGICDIDERDDYKEIVLYDLGASADSTLIILRFCDDDIYELGTFRGNSGYDSILFDKNGRIVESFGYIDFVEPQIVTEYFEVIGNKAERMDLDYSSYMNKTYSVSKEVTAAFYETDNYNWDEAHFDLEKLIVIKEGQEIQLIKAEPSKGLYYVQLPDGRRGVLTTRIAG